MPCWKSYILSAKTMKRALLAFVAVAVLFTAGTTFAQEAPQIDQKQIKRDAKERAKEAKRMQKQAIKEQGSQRKEALKQQHDAQKQIAKDHTAEQKKAEKDARAQKKQERDAIKEAKKQGKTLHDEEIPKRKSRKKDKPGQESTAAPS